MGYTIKTTTGRSASIRVSSPLKQNKKTTKTKKNIFTGGKKVTQKYTDTFGGVDRKVKTVKKYDKEGNIIKRKVKVKDPVYGKKTFKKDYTTSPIEKHNKKQ